eukprot:1471928-Pyramimonas_sp.AAC.1
MAWVCTRDAPCANGMGVYTRHDVFWLAAGEVASTRGVMNYIDNQLAQSGIVIRRQHAPVRALGWQHTHT